MQWTRGDIVRQAVFGQAVRVLPVWFVCGGVGAVSDQQPRLAVIWYAAALVSLVVCARSWRRAMELMPHAQTVGQLRDRVFALAEKARVKLEQLYVLPASKGGWPTPLQQQVTR